MGECNILDVGSNISLHATDAMCVPECERDRNSGQEMRAAVLVNHKNDPTTERSYGHFRLSEERYERKNTE